MCWATASCDSNQERDVGPGIQTVQNGVSGRDHGVECAGCGALLRREFRPDPD